ncbi:hypothetical protein HAX54_052501, partial [Datura stramonium]|nr:hypothetical protein [Datura stramonium]
WCKVVCSTKHRYLFGSNLSLTSKQLDDRQANQSVIVSAFCFLLRSSGASKWSGCQSNQWFLYVAFAWQLQCATRLSWYSPVMMLRWRVFASPSCGTDLISI